MKKDPLIIVVSAPSGSGKTTLTERILEKMDGIRRSVSYTTRQPRDGEKDAQDYVFISEKDFKEKADNGEFLEWEENFGNFYGTPLDQFRTAMEEGVDVILSIDVKGGKTVKEKFPESVSVFIIPPSVKELEERLRNRNTDREEQVAMRLEESKREMAAADRYDYLIVNEDLDKASEELMTIIEKERESRNRA
ncbi:MAG: guanylate kinase [Candidatus Omnitrophota bacterium]|nr:guanylate kinase [Candidatus Omnitrophota bacterium]